MKKVFTLMAALMAGSAVMLADNVVFIGETGYESIYDAVTAAADNDVIEIKGDITIGNRLDLNKPLTLKANDGVTVSCRNKNHLAILVKNSVTMNNLNLVYTDDASNQALIETSTAAGKLTMENCAVSNFNTTSGQGALCMKSDGTATLNNVTFSGNVVPEGRGEVFIGKNGTVINGTTNASVFVEKSLNFTAGETLAPVSPIRLYVEDSRTVGSILVMGTEDVAKFNLMSDKFSLKAQDGNIVAGEYTAGEGAVTIGQLGFGNLTDALAAAQEGDIISINEDITLSNGVTLKDVNNLTIEAKDGVTVSCLMKNKRAFTVGCTAALKNLNLVYTDKDPSNATLIESSNGANLTMENCVIKDFNGSNNQGIVCAKSNGKVTLNNVTVENCTVAEGRGELFLGSNGSTINGTTNMSIFLEKNNNVTAGAEFAPAQAVKLFVDENRTLGSIIVAGTEDATKFALQGSAFSLVAQDGNLVAGEYNPGSGIAGIAADENAPVEYYNLNGVKVNADNMTPGVYVRRQGNTTVKVLVK